MMVIRIHPEFAVGSSVITDIIAIETLPNLRHQYHAFPQLVLHQVFPILLLSRKDPRVVFPIFSKYSGATLATKSNTK